MDGYYFDKNNICLIYGAGLGGRKLYESLSRMGYEISAFIDQRARQIGQLDSKDVLLLSDYCGRREETVIIISVANYFEHPGIAQALYGSGFKKIIYMPFQKQFGQSSYENRMTEIYKNIVNGHCSNFGYIPFYQPNERSYFRNSAELSRHSEKNVVVSVPLDLCYTQIISGYSKEKNMELYQSSDLPFYIGKYKLIEYFKVFEGTSPDPAFAVEEYHDFVLTNEAMYQTYPKDSAGLSSLFQNRQSVYQAMNQALHDGMKFFEETPVKLVWNKNGYFNLLDGHHRLAFFCVKGISRIPAEISCQDYKKWLNETKIQSCVAAAEKGRFPYADTPIEHPFFYHYPSQRDLGGFTRLQNISFYIARKKLDVKKKKVLDIGGRCSGFSRFFSRMGAEVTAIETDENHYFFARQLNQLLYCNTLKLYCEKIECFHPSESFDLVLMLDVLETYMDTGLDKIMLKQIARMTKSMLIWESGKRVEAEKKLILESTDFSEYERLGYSINRGYLSEMGVFYKNMREYNI